MCAVLMHSKQTNRNLGILGRDSRCSEISNATQICGVDCVIAIIHMSGEKKSSYVYRVP